LDDAPNYTRKRTRSPSVADSRYNEDHRDGRDIRRRERSPSPYHASKPITSSKPTSRLDTEKGHEVGIKGKADANAGSKSGTGSSGQDGTGKGKAKAVIPMDVDKDFDLDSLAASLDKVASSGSSRKPDDGLPPVPDSDDDADGEADNSG